MIVTKDELCRWFQEFDKEYFQFKKQKTKIPRIILQQDTIGHLAFINEMNVITFTTRALSSERLAKFCLYHEMCHIKYKNHGAEFYRMLETYKGWKPTWWESQREYAYMAQSGRRS